MSGVSASRPRPGTGFTIRLLINLTVCFAVAAVYLSGCSAPRTAPTVNTTVGAVMDHSAARKLSDSLVDDLTNDRRENIRARTEKAFQDEVGERQFNLMLEQMLEANGKLLEHELKQEEVGSKLYADSQSKPMIKFWYAVRTTRYEMGSHFLIVEVVPDGDGLAVSSFAIVTFSQEVPPALK